MMISKLNDVEFAACYGTTREKVRLYAAWLELLIEEYERNPHPATLNTLEYTYKWLKDVAERQPRSSYEE